MGLYSRIAGLLSGPVQWISSVVAPGFSQAAAVSGAGANLTIAPQAATTTGASGSVIANVAAPASGTAEAGLSLKRGGTSYGQLFPVSGNPTWLGIYPGGVTPGASNYVFLSLADGSNTQVCSTTSVSLTVASTAIVAVTATAVTVASGALFQGGTSGIKNVGPLVQSGAVTGASGAPFNFSNSAVTLATSGTTSLSAAQQGTPNLTIAAVTLVGAAVLDFGNVTGNFQVNILGVNAASFGTFGLSFKNGTTTTALPSTALTNGGLVIVRCDPNLLAFCA